MAMRKLILVFIAALFLGYLAFAGRGIFLPPPLEVFSPAGDLVTANRNIELSGQTLPGVRVIINGAQILPNEKGFFQENLMLQNGLNILEIKALKRYARPRVLERKILVSQKDSTLSQKGDNKNEL